MVDDFEMYNNTCNRIFWAWVDGYGSNGSTDCGVAASAGNGTGSTVGHADPPFAERTIVHGGRQSMPFFYDNTTGKSTSEATRTFTAAQDWTAGGLKTLVLFFRGDAANGAGQLYVTINGTKVLYNGGVDALAASLWRQWNIDLATVGANLKAVKTLGVGVSGSGKGVLCIDDIRLYREAPAVVVPVDPGNSGLVANYKMEADVKDSSGKGYNGTANGNPVYVDGASGNGKALQFDGLDDYVDLPIGPLISTLTSSSYAVWVSWPGTGGAWQRVFDFGNSASTGYMFLTPQEGGGNVRFAISQTDSGGESMVTSPSPLATGWHHLVVVIDGGSKTLTLFMDGEAVASGPTALLPSALGKTTQNWLGRSQYADPYYNGIVDEFRIYNRALSAGEVRYLAGDR